jgi:hypothetical protein
MSEFDVPDPDDIREAGQRARQRGETLESLINTWALMYLIEHSEDGKLEMPTDELERYGTGETGKVLVVQEVDGRVIFQTADDPPSANAQAILDGGPNWVRAESGQPVKVTGADGDSVVFVAGSADGGWGEPERWHSGCFLRDHVLAAGVPMLGSEDA